MIETFFFFSSRRRHTRFSRDWSSDVCSSDLTPSTCAALGKNCGTVPDGCGGVRSEERRVGKECRSRGAEDQSKKKKCADCAYSPPLRNTLPITALQRHDASYKQTRPLYAVCS